MHGLCVCAGSAVSKYPWSMPPHQPCQQLGEVTPVAWGLESATLAGPPVWARERLVPKARLSQEPAWRGKGGELCGEPPQNEPLQQAKSARDANVQIWHALDEI